MWRSNFLLRLIWIQCSLLSVQPSLSNSTNLTWVESSDKIISILKTEKDIQIWKEPPRHKNGEATEVDIGIYIESMSSFRSASMDFDVDIYLVMSWRDPRLRHNWSHPILVTETKQLARWLWFPDLVFHNLRKGQLPDASVPNSMVLVYSDGFVLNSTRLFLTLFCNLDLYRYPMDRQECPIYILSYAYVEAVLKLRWHMDLAAGYPIGMNPSIALSDMAITHKTWDTCQLRSSLIRGHGNWSCLVGKIGMRRLLTFHVMGTFVPSAVLVVVSWLSFWLEPRVPPARICLSITAFLTLATMTNRARSDVASISYIKALDVWLAVCTAFVFGVLLELSLINSCLNKKTQNCAHMRLVKKMTSACRKLLLNKEEGSEQLRRRALLSSCGICASRWERRAIAIDRHSRLFFPLSFSLFILFYWTYFAIF